MRSYFPALLGIYCLALPVALWASNGTTGEWQVLEGCRLVSASSNNGDSFKVKHQAEVFIARLYFVDCSEANETDMERVRDQARYFSIPESAVIASGKLAWAHTQTFLSGEFTVITKRVDARGSKEPCIFALVRKNNTMLSAELVRHGLARLYGMPTKGTWPGGVSAPTYLRQFKQHERTAQRNMTGIWGDATGSIQLAGLNQLSSDVEGAGISKASTAPATVTTASHTGTGKLILNTASAEALDTLPGIGPALAAHIIAARPIAAVDNLAEIPGITLAKIDVFRAQVLTDKPPPPPKTAAFYLADIEAYLNQDVTVIVSGVAQSDLIAPESFRAVNLLTANEGTSGGEIPALIPDEFYDSFMQYYQAPGRTFTGLLFQHDSTIVLVYSRK